jgi:alpha,alpha-trehalose phosphorylase
VEPWSVREATLDLESLARTESVFALSNGHIGLRGNLDEGEPFAVPGSYLNSFYELRPLPYAEAGYGYPESGQTVVNVTNGKIIRLLVDDEPFDVRYGELLAHVRELDLRGGVLRRRVEWRSPTGAAVRVTSTRLVSFVQRACGAILYEVEPLEEPLRVVVQSELVANEPAPARSDDPRAAAALESPLVSQEFFDHAARAVLVHGTRASELGIAAGMDHLIEGPARTDTAAESRADLARVTVAADLAPGERLRVVKFLAYAWSSRRSYAALRDEVVAALAEARHTGWEGLVAGQRVYLDEFWASADVELEGDTELQQAVRFALSTRSRRERAQSSARSPRRASRAPATTATPSGTRSGSSCRCSPTPFRVPPATRCAGARRRSTSPARALGSSASPARSSPGGRSAGTSAPATGPLERPPSTSRETSPTPSRAIRPLPSTRRSSSKQGSSCSSRRHGCGGRSAITTPMAASG